MKNSVDNSVVATLLFFLGTFTFASDVLNINLPKQINAAVPFCTSDTAEYPLMKGMNKVLVGTRCQTKGYIDLPMGNSQIKREFSSGIEFNSAIVQKVSYQFENGTQQTGWLNESSNIIYFTDNMTSTQERTEAIHSCREKKGAYLPVSFDDYNTAGMREVIRLFYKNNDTLEDSGWAKRYDALAWTAKTCDNCVQAGFHFDAYTFNLSTAEVAPASQFGFEWPGTNKIAPVVICAIKNSKR